MITFAFTDDHQHQWPAPTSGEPWNGAVTPHVDRDTLAQVFAYVLMTNDTYTAMHIEPDGTATLAENDCGNTYLTVCRPDTDGLYDLGIFGWTLQDITP